MRYSFREFLRLDEETKTRLGTLELNEDISGKQKNKLKDLEKKLKEWDYTYVYSDERNAYKKGVAQEKEIIKLYKEIGAEGLKMYRDFLKSKGMKECFENNTTPRLNPYEKFIQKKMDSWGIKSLDELQPEPYKRFWNEIDDEWEKKNKKNSDVKFNLPEQKSIFPEQNASQRNMQLGYGEQRPVDGRSKHGFVDAGDLYYNQPQYVPPSKERKKRYE
jgi:hypothetical protein